MPYVISDSLYERLEGCVKQQRLLGVMGMLEELRASAVGVGDGHWEYSSTKGDRLIWEIKEAKNARETNSDEDIDGGF